MNPTLSYLLGRKMWWVPGVNVWGTIADFQPKVLITETEGAVKRILHTTLMIGGSVQQIEYKNLVDLKNNALPQEMVNPRVIALSKSDVQVMVQGTEGSKSFTLAKTTPTDRIGVVDLLIIEMG